MRPVHAAGRPVHEEGLVRVEGAPVVEPVERLVDHVRGEVVCRVVVRRLDRVVVLGQARLVLRGLAAEEAVEMLEAVAVRPAVLRADRGGLDDGRVVPLAEGGGVVAVVLQDLGDGGGVLRDDAGVAVPGDRALGDGAGADAGVVAARSAARRGWASRSRWCGTGCRRCPRPRGGRGSGCAPRRRRSRRRRSRRRRAARSGCSARPAGRCCCAGGQIIVESCSRGAATPAIGAGGKGRTEPSARAGPGRAARRGGRRGRAPAGACRVPMSRATPWCDPRRSCPRRG